MQSFEVALQTPQCSTPVLVAQLVHFPSTMEYPAEHFAQVVPSTEHSLHWGSFVVVKHGEHLPSLNPKPAVHVVQEAPWLSSQSPQLAIIQLVQTVSSPEVSPQYPGTQVQV